jgi:hypothetical protein
MYPPVNLHPAAGLISRARILWRNKLGPMVSAIGVSVAPCLADGCRYLTHTNVPFLRTCSQRGAAQSGFWCCLTYSQASSMELAVKGRKTRLPLQTR